MKLFPLFFRRKRLMYNELPANERIQQFIEKSLFPDFATLGFRLDRYRLVMSRNVGEFRQEIQFIKNKTNKDKENVAFDLLLGVSLPGYAQWHKQQYSDTPLSEGIMGSRCQYIPRWSSEYLHNGWYDLQHDDNYRLLSSLKKDLKQCGLPYLDKLSDRTTAIQFLMEMKVYSKSPMLFDFALQLGDKAACKTILDWFDRERELSAIPFRNVLIKEMEIRRKLL